MKKIQPGTPQEQLDQLVEYYNSLPPVDLNKPPTAANNIVRHQLLNNMERLLKEHPELDGATVTNKIVPPSTPKYIEIAIGFKKE